MCFVASFMDVVMSERTHDLLFIYGTLLSVAGHPMGDLLRTQATRVGAGTIRARLYIVREVDDEGENFYPGAVPSANPQDQVYGEVYRLTDPGQVYPDFDRFEACAPEWPEPHEFLLRRIPVQMEDGTHMTAVAYLYAWDVTGAEFVPSGRYERYAPTVR